MAGKFYTDRDSSGREVVAPEISNQGKTLRSLSKPHIKAAADHHVRKFSAQL